MGSGRLFDLLTVRGFQDCDRPTILIVFNPVNTIGLKWMYVGMLPSSSVSTI